LVLKAKKPVNTAYPKELVTLGDHLRKVRLDKGMSQPQVSLILNTSTDMVTNWELNRNEPTPKFAKLIIEFIGYVPFSLENASLGKRIYYARLMSGMTQDQISKEIGCDESNLRNIELDIRKPGVELNKKIGDFINRVFNHNNESYTN